MKIKMKNKIFKSLNQIFLQAGFIVLIIVFIHSCVITPPNIILTGKKTPIENQIIGEYSELEKDAWIISSADTNLQSGIIKTAETGDEELLLAMKIREFHGDKINEYKNEGAIGEKNDGFISYMDTQKYESNKEQKSILLSVIDEENEARKTIFVKSLIRSGTPEPSDADILAFGRQFGDEQQSLSLKNHWIQDKTGKWAKKK